MDLRLSVIIRILLFIAMGINGATHTWAAQIKFTCVAWNSIDDGIMVDLGSQQVPIQANSDFRSEAYSYAGEGPIRFYQNQVDINGGTFRRILGEIRVPKELDNVLIILRKKNQMASDEFPYDAIVLDDSRTYFPMGSYRIYNFSKQEVAGKVGSEQFKLMPRKHCIIKPADVDGERLPVQLLIEGSVGEWEKVVSTLWYHRASKRVLLFVMDDENPRRAGLKLRSIPEYAE